MAFSLILGVLLGLGLYLLVSSFPRLGRTPLAGRVAPYVADISSEAFRIATRVATAPAGTLKNATGILAQRFSQASDRILGDSAVTARRLRQAGGHLSVETYRARQLLWALGGLGAGLAVDAGVQAVRSLGLAANVTTSGVDNVVPSVSVAALLAVPLAALVGGYFAAELALRRSVRRRLQRISSELPTVFEFLSLCLAAGESITDSLNRVARVGSGDFAAELAQVARQVGTGVPLASALSQLSSRLQLPPVTRGVEQILGALDRGSPLAAVLAAQAQDAREDSKRELLEKAGQKEVVMLIPLVFLILPVTILFAVFPGLMVIQAGF